MDSALSQAKDARTCLVCDRPVHPEARPCGWFAATFGNGLLCGRGTCLEAAIQLADDFAYEDARAPEGR